MSLKQSKLSFAVITVAAAHTQQVNTAEQWEREHSGPTSAVPSEPVVVRGPGRPRKKRPNESEDAAAIDKPHTKPGKNTNWFSSPYIADVLQAYRQNHFSAKAAVRWLKDRSPDPARYAKLSDSTVRGWFDKDHKLLPRFQQQFNAGRAASRSNGRPAQLSDALGRRCQEALRALRAEGVPVNSHVIRWTIKAVVAKHEPALVELLPLSQPWISKWVSSKKRLNWSWRHRTNDTSKLPLTWRDDGVMMAKRIASAMAVHKVHPSLVVNMDQTGVHLVPAARWTYNEKNSKSVGTIGAEDKRAITACVASSLYGDMLPLQLIFQGTTPRVLPTVTEEITRARVHLTKSKNHWSDQETMREWLTEVLLPYAARCTAEHGLPVDSKIVLILDAWAVHKSEEFRLHLRMHHPRIKLVFVPANCTSKLQVADVALQRPFKAAIRRNFDLWAAELSRTQFEEGSAKQFAKSFQMASIKPLVTQWCIDSWTQLQSRKSVIAEGWYHCVTSLYDVYDVQLRVDAVVELAETLQLADHVPEGVEGDPMDSEDESDAEEAGSDAESDGDGPELDVTQPVVHGWRRSTRQRGTTASHGYMLNSQNIVMTEDSEA